MAVRFYLHKRGNSQREKPLRIHVWRGPLQIAETTTVRVKASDWSQRLQRVKASVPGATEVNGGLAKLRSDVEALTLLYVDEDELRKAIKVRLGKTAREREPEILELYGSFLDFKKARVKPSTMQVYEALREHLTAFLKDGPVKPSEITPGFLEDFTSYLIDGGLANSTANKLTTRARGFLTWMVERGHIDKAPKAGRLATPAKFVVHLTLDELQAIHSVDLSGEQPGYEKARDLFLLCCYTGQRIGDVTSMAWDDVRGDWWHLHVKKTNVVRRIPIVGPAAEIIDKYAGTSRPVPDLSAQKANRFIKTIGEMAGITEPVSIKTQRGGSVETETVPKWQVLTMHVGRRTFITALLEGGVSQKDLLNLTHDDLRSLRLYAGQNEAGLQRSMQAIFRSPDTRSA